MGVLVLAAIPVVSCSASSDVAGPGDVATSTVPSDIGLTTVTTVTDTKAPDTVAAATTAVPVTEPPVPTSEPIEAGGDALGPLGSTELDVETDEGRVQIGTGEVPAGAAGMPLPDDFAVDLASETVTDLGFSGTTTLLFDDVVDFYRARLPEAGFEVTDGASALGTFQILDVTDGEWTGNILINTSPDTTDTTITVALQTG